MHAIANSKSPFFFVAEYDSIVYMPSFFLCPSTEEHGGGFHVLALVNNDTSVVLSSFIAVFWIYTISRP